MIILINKVRRSLTFRKEYLIGPGSKIYKTASIVNGLHQRALIEIGSFCHIKGEILIFGHGGAVAIGDYCFVGENTHIWSAKKIQIGNRVLISHNCNIFDNDTHPLDAAQRHQQFSEIITTGQPKQIDLKEEDVIIEDDVLIGANSIILKGVRIGKAAVIGAGSVVTQSIPSKVVVAGNPAKIIKRLEGDVSLLHSE